MFLFFTFCFYFFVFIFFVFTFSYMDILFSRVSLNLPSLSNFSWQDNFFDNSQKNYEILILTLKWLQHWSIFFCKHPNFHWRKLFCSRKLGLWTAFFMLLNLFPLYAVDSFLVASTRSLRGGQMFRRVGIFLGGQFWSW